ncbi:hypothetical protein ACJX0J_016153, partial [Zea mays]
LHVLTAQTVTRISPNFHKPTYSASNNFVYITTFIISISYLKDRMINFYFMSKKVRWFLGSDEIQHIRRIFSFYSCFNRVAHDQSQGMNLLKIEIKEVETFYLYTRVTSVR